MPELETVSVLWPDKGPGTFQINATDFDPQIHTRAEDQGTSAQEPGAGAASESDKTKHTRGRRSR